LNEDKNKLYNQLNDPIIDYAVVLM